MENGAADAERWAGRYHVERLPAVGVEFEIPGGQAAHAAGSRRARAGDAVTLFDGSGRDLHCRIRAASKRGVVVVGESMTETGPPLPVPVICASALPKGARADDMVSQCAQLGVSSFVPVGFARSVARPGGNWQKRRQRFRRLAIEAAKQSGASTLMEIGAPAGFDEFLQASECGLRLCGAPRADNTAAAVMAGRWPFRRLTFLVGPEGGMTAAESEAVAGAGFIPVRIARTTLRIETACTAFAALAAAYLCDHGS